MTETPRNGTPLKNTHPLQNSAYASVTPRLGSDHPLVAAEIDDAE